MEINELQLKMSLDMLIRGGLFYEEDFELLQSLGIRDFIRELKSRHIYSLLERKIIAEDDLKEIQFYEDLLNLPKIKQFEYSKTVSKINKKEGKMGKNMLTLIVSENENSDLSMMKLIFQNVFMYLIKEGCLLSEEIFWVKNQDGLIHLILEAKERLRERNMIDEWEKYPNYFV